MERLPADKTASGGSGSSLATRRICATAMHSEVACLGSVVGVWERRVLPGQSRSGVASPACVMVIQFEVELRDEMRICEEAESRDGRSPCDRERWR